MGCCLGCYLGRCGDGALGALGVLFGGAVRGWQGAREHADGAGALRGACMSLFGVDTGVN